MQALSASVLARLARAELQTYDLSQLRLDEARAQQALGEELAGLHAKLNSAATMTARCEQLGVPGSTPADYAEQVVRRDGEMLALCGIRHANLNPKLPFVSLRTDVVPTRAEAVVELYAQVAERFRVFRPRWVAVSTPRPIGGQLRATWMMQRAAALRAREPWPVEDSLSLELLSSTDYYPWYRRGYDHFLEENPHFVDLVAPSELSSLEQSRQEGLLRGVRIDGERVGLIAAVDDDFLGHSGVYVTEIFVAATHRGRGLGKALQRRFVAECCPRDALVWGTIDNDNQPSLGTARANGRLPIRYESFVPLAR